jgi:hypothetical protein
VTTSMGSRFARTEPRQNKSLCLTLYLLAICFSPSLSDSFIFLTLTRLVVVLKFIKFRFALFTPPLGDFHQLQIVIDLDGDKINLNTKFYSCMQLKKQARIICMQN